MNSDGLPGGVAGSPSTAAQFLRNYLFLLPALALLIQGATNHYDIPGLNSDTINPDFLLLQILNPREYIPIVFLPGQNFLGVFPVLIQVYHGALPYYIGLPIYLLFGTSVLGVRLANCFYAALVLFGLAALCRAFRIRPWIAGAALAALAIDPGFIFAFRTQFYITTLPLALLAASSALVERHAFRLTRRTALFAGFLAGLAPYGYFNCFFLLPAAAYHVWRRSAQSGDRNWRRLDWGMGVALGLSPYAFGLLLMMYATGGPQDLLNFLKMDLTGLGIAKPSFGFHDRVSFAANMLWSASRGFGPIRMMVRDMPLYAPHLKSDILLGAPVLLAALNLVLRRKTPAAALVVLQLGGIVAMFLVFGNRAGYHHASPSLPIMYFALAALLEVVLSNGAAPGLERLPNQAEPISRFNSMFERIFLSETSATYRRYALTFVAIVPIVVLFFINAIDRQHVMVALERTGGSRLYSDAMLRFADDSLRITRPTRAFFPDWGILEQFAMETGAAIPTVRDFSPDMAKNALCSGEDALLAVIDGKSSERLATWVAQVDWPAPEVAVYKQRDGVPVMIALRWRADDPTAKRCKG